MLLVFYAFGVLCYDFFVLWFWCFLVWSLYSSHTLLIWRSMFWVSLFYALSVSMLLVFLWSGLFVLVLWCCFALISLFWCFGVSLIWSFCSDVLVLLWFGLFVLVLWCCSDLVSLSYPGGLCFDLYLLLWWSMLWFLSLTLVIYAFGDVCLGPFLPISQALVFYALVLLCSGVSMLWCFGAMSLLSLWSTR